MTEPHMDCDKCQEHKAWEERMKILDKVPGILSWMNVMKGAIAVIIFIFPIMYAQQVAERSDVTQKLKDHETQISHKQDKISEQVTAIGKDTEAIRSNVAVMVKSMEMKNVETEKAINELKMYRPR